MRQRNLLLAVALSLLCAPGAWAGPPDAEVTTQTKTVSLIISDGAKTDTALWTPTSGNFFVLMGCAFSTKQAGTVELEVSDADVIPPQHFQTAGKASIGFGAYPLYVSAVDAVLTYTTSVAGEFSILCTGYEARQ